MYCGSLLVSEMVQNGSSWDLSVSRPFNFKCVLIPSAVIGAGVFVVHPVCFCDGQKGPVLWLSFSQVVFQFLNIPYSKLKQHS